MLLFIVIHSGTIFMVLNKKKLDLDYEKVISQKRILDTILYYSILDFPIKCFNDNFHPSII